MVNLSALSDSDLILLREKRRRMKARTAYVPSVAEFISGTQIEVPQQDGVSTMPFDLWPAQHNVLDAMDTRRLLIILKARQLGISWLACAYVLWLCTCHPGKTVLLFSIGQLEANELVRRITFLFASHTDRARLPQLQTENTTELVWSNGSRVKSLPATKRAGRSFTASLLIADEFAFMMFGPALLAAAKPTINDGGKLWIISSADGNGTPYHRFWQQAENGTNGYHPVFLPWQANPNRDATWRDRLMDEATEASDVLREYPESPIEAFTHATGLVYDVWSDGPEDGNVQESADYIEGGGRILWAVDDGYAGTLDRATGTFTAESHPRVFLLIQQRPTGQLCVFAESYAVKKLDDEHIAEVLAMPYPKAEAAAVDKSAAQLKGRLWAHSIPTLTGPTSVEESIKTLRRLIARDSNGVRMLLVHPRCTHLRKEMASYRRDEVGNIIKQHDHGCDSARYMAHALRYET